MKIQDLSTEELLQNRPELNDITKMVDSEGKEDFHRRQAALALRQTIDEELNKRALSQANQEAANKVVYGNQEVDANKFWHAQCGETEFKFIINETIADYPCQKCGKLLKKWAEIG